MSLVDYVNDFMTN